MSSTLVPPEPPSTDPIRIFVSSVQSEFALERAALLEYLRTDALMRRFFEVLLFEAAPAMDQSPQSLYLQAVSRCDIYVGLFGEQYGSKDHLGLSPTEHEFNRATELKKYRLIYLRRSDNDKSDQDPRMAALTARAAKELKYSEFSTSDDLKRQLQESLVDYLLRNLFRKLHPSNDAGPTAEEASDILRRYTAAFQHLYTPSDTLIPFSCLSDGQELSSDEVLRSISVAGDNMLLLGPSGSGKTLLATNAAHDSIQRDHIPVFVRVRNYTTGLASILDREAPLLNTPSITHLLRAAQRLHRSILLVVDGYNECDAGVWEPLRTVIDTKLST